MKREDLIWLLKNVYLLAFEAGVNSGNHHDSEYRWECDKYYFEKDIERLSNE